MGNDEAAEAAQDTRHNAQAHLVRAAKVRQWTSKTASGTVQLDGYRTRDWSLFYFFRILPDAVSANGNPAESEGVKKPNASRFRAWLKVLTSGHEDDNAASALKLLSSAAKDNVQSSKSHHNDDDVHEDIGTRLIRELIDGHSWAVGNSLAIAYVIDALRTRGHSAVVSLLDELNPTRSPDAPWILLRLTLYELIRQAAPSVLPGNHLPVIRCEAHELRRTAAAAATDVKKRFDRTPVNICFTYPGLEALQFKRETLASFPDAFKQGMAHRAALLRDVGENAPEHWEGALGLRSVHGYFSGTSDLGHGRAIPESFWKRLRAEIEAFNDPIDEDGQVLREHMRSLLALVGIEALHVELGQDPYRVVKARAQRLPQRTDHFGFRDGLSQPDLGLGLEKRTEASRRGDGTPSRRATWTPVALGEIFLDQKDETGYHHRSPRNRILRTGSTFIVFRKLEQDVVGFHAYLAKQRQTAAAQDALSAQIVGRWPNGTSLVHSPDVQRGRAEAHLNDFRYVAEDPLGLKCPLGAHVRRANPRDIGGRDNVRHHRILRRGISYGGPLIARGDPDDGGKRGILFIAINARIDTQFEVIQAAWLNGGEFQGQAGLGRCPLSGTREGREGATFMEAGAGVPLRGLPQFVTTRGGDYFFAPGIAGLRGIASGDSFAPDDEDQFGGYCTAGAGPVSPFGETSIRVTARDILIGKQRVARYTPKPSAINAGRPLPTVAFVAKHADVTEVLCNQVAGTNATTTFSVAQIREAGLRISRGDEWPIGTDVRGPGAAARARMWTILDLGWKKFDEMCRVPCEQPCNASAANLDLIVKEHLEMALRRVAGTRNVDMIDDLAAPAAYGVVSKFLGLPGPPWLTEMAVALPFSRQHFGSLPREWMLAVRGEMPSDRRLATMQIWTCVMTADLIANAQNARELQALSRQAGSEMLNHIDLELQKARSRIGRAHSTPTLVDAFMEIAGNREIVELYSSDCCLTPDDYYRDVSVILLEIASSTMAIIPFTFGQVMQSLIEHKSDLCAWVRDLDNTDLDMAIYEAERLNPNIAFRLRKCEVPTIIGGQQIFAGDTVMALTGAAGNDRGVFPDPEQFSLGKAGCPMRLKDNYLLFGVPSNRGSNKDCWGRDRVALPVLRQCLRAAGRLRGLRRVAGPRGEAQKLAGVTIGLPTRFTAIGPSLEPTEG